MRVRMTPGTVWHWLCKNDCLVGMGSREGRKGNASNSERLRWLNGKAVIINGKQSQPMDTFPDNLESLVFFPKGKGKITMC